MAGSPNFSATPTRGSAQLSSTPDTSYTAPSHTVTIFTAGANGGIVNEIDLVGAGTTVAGVVNIFYYDTSSYWLIDSFVVPVVTPSTTIAPYRASRTYANLILAGNHTIVATSWAANQLITASAFGGSF